MKRSSFWVIALSFVTPLLLSGQANAQIRIMPAGDSITQGFGNVCSYRRPLSQALIQNACNVQFVGSRTTAGGNASSTGPISVCAAQNTDHQAVSGDRADQILNNSRYNFTNELNRLNREPDIVLLHIGSNDIFGNQSVASTVEDINDIINEVFEQRPGATVVVADVIPWSEESPTNLSSLSKDNLDMLALSAELSTAVTTLVNNRASSGEAVVLAEVKGGFDNDLMTTDGVHPNPIGEAHIANKMLDALYGLGVCGSSPADVQPPITYISVPSEAGEQLGTSPTLSGTALDDGGSGIDRVRIAIEQLDNNSEPRNPRLWLNYSEGTFNSTFDRTVVADIPSTGTDSTSWSITTGLTAGNYRLFALALDGNENQVEEAAGNGQPDKNEKVWTSRAFEVGIGEPPGPPEPLVPPAKTTLIAPSGSSGTDTPQYQWNAVDNASWYLLWVNDDTGTPIREWHTAEAANCSSETCSVTPSIAVSGDVRWWVLTWSSSGNGPWSDSLAFNSGPPPGQATLISPTGAVGSNTPTYSWNAVAGSSWYYLWVNDSTGTPVRKWYKAVDVGCPGGTGVCTVTPSTAIQGDATWWIQTWNSAGHGPWSARAQFQ